MSKTNHWMADEDQRTVEVVYDTEEPEVLLIKETIYSGEQGCQQSIRLDLMEILTLVQLANQHLMDRTREEDD